MADNYFSKNLRFLRETVFGETQIELANALHISNSTICKYEGENRLISVENLNKISEHYGVSVDSLLYQDLSASWTGKLPYDNMKNPIQPFLDFYHLFVSEKALKNESFAKAAHLCLESGPLTIEEIHWRIERCIKLFIKAWEQDHLFESVANVVMLMLLDYGTLQTEKQFRIVDEYLHDSHDEKNNKKMSLKYRNSVSSDDQDKRREYITEHYEGLLYYLVILKNYPEGVDLAYFYLAYSYILGYANNQFNNEKNLEIGFSMMDSYRNFGNIYATNYINGMWST